MTLHVARQSDPEPCSRSLIRAPGRQTLPLQSRGAVLHSAPDGSLTNAQCDTAMVPPLGNGEHAKMREIALVAAGIVGITAGAATWTGPNPVSAPAPDVAGISIYDLHRALAIETMPELTIRDWV